MMTLLHLAVLSGTVLVLAKALPGVRIKSGPAAVAVAVVFSLLNWALGWLVGAVAGAVLFIPAVLTLGLMFLLVPFVVNTVVLWLTDKLLHVFEIRDLGSLLLSSGAITLVSWVFHVIVR